MDRYLIRKCCQCKEDIGVVVKLVPGTDYYKQAEEKNDNIYTHGYCNECFEKELSKMEEFSYEL